MKTHAVKAQEHTSQSASNQKVLANNVSALQIVDNRPESVSQRWSQKIITNGSNFSASQKIQTKNNAIQLMSDGTDFSRKLLGAKAEEKTALKQWKSGEFYAWDRTNERKDHHHIHTFKPNVGQDKVVVTGHVVTAKGEDNESNLRNLTQHEIVGTQGQNDEWTVASQKTRERLELNNGSKEVPKEKHTEEELLLRYNMVNAVHHLLNTPDNEISGVDKAADKIATKLAKKERRKLAKRKKKALAEGSSDEEDYGSYLFNLGE